MDIFYIAQQCTTGKKSPENGDFNDSSFFVNERIRKMPEFEWEKSPSNHQIISKMSLDLFIT